VVFVLVLLGASAPLDDARAQYAAMKFQAVVETLEGVRGRDAVELRARALVALGRADEAEAAWLTLLEADPQAEGPHDASPKVQAVFERARARVPAPPPPPPPLSPPPHPPEEPLTIVLRPIEPPAPEPPRWIAWSLAAGGALSLGVGSALAVWANGDVQSARSARWASDARAFDERAMGSAAAANVLLAGALVCGITSGILFWRWR